MATHPVASVRRVILALMFTASIASTVAAEPWPEGKDYPAGPLYTGKPAGQIDKTDAFTRTFRTRFWQAMQGDVVFAGEFAQAEWGCGSSGCRVVAFINKRTGRALSRAFMAYEGGDANDPASIGEVIVYQDKASNLLVTYETSSSGAVDEKFYNYYVLDKAKSALKLINKRPDTQPR